MAFTVEDGTGVSGANSYVSLGEADAYHLDRGNAAWIGADNAEKQAALIKATDYIDQAYKFLGRRSTDVQGLEWPRDCVPTVEGDEIPKRLRQAASQLALTALTVQLNPDIVPGAQVKSKKVDVIEVEYFESTVKRTIRPAIDGLLKGLIGRASWNVPVTRV